MNKKILILKENFEANQALQQVATAVSNEMVAVEADENDLQAALANEDPDAYSNALGIPFPKKAFKKTT